ncbi:hypothetical protein NMY22_g72 [Coprinellus aureogranulatus]|nr:hypothetical protein NMY22_g72 [Coprinellus aureogranulatus]
MSSDEEQGYEVDFVQEARVSKKGGKRGKLYWEFKVRWKGYTSNDDTWEPIESFNTTEVIQEFWARTRDPRDVFNINDFTVGEKFLPKGPPPRKSKKSKSTTAVPTSVQDVQTTPPASASTPAQFSLVGANPTPLDISDLPAGTKRRRGFLESNAKQPPHKKSREDAPESASATKSTRNSSRREQPQSPSRSRKKGREESPELIPDSDEEAEEALKMDDSGLDTRDSSRSAQEVASKLEFAPPSPPATNSPTEKPDSLFDEEGDMPAHRRRQQKPLVKMFEDPSLHAHEGQLSAKANAISNKRSDTDVATSSRSRPGPGRSSSGMVRKPTLLTANKGTLKSMRTSTRRQSKPGAQSNVPHREPTPMPIDEPFTLPEPEEPPTGQELLHMAGLDPEEAEELPDFEDGTSSQNLERVATEQERAENLKKAQESLFPTPATEVDSPNKFWNSSTIFGLMTSGKHSSSNLPTEGDVNHPNASPFTVVLDSLTKVPVLFTDTSGGQLLPEFTAGEHLAAPGRFYSGDATLSLLNTVRSSGIAGRVIVRSDASPHLKEHFQRFSQRLQNGDLFVSNLGLNVFAFCSSDSTLLCSRMNISPGLQISERQVLVCKVIVENSSEYLKVIEQADSRQWTDYVASLT